MTSKKPSFLASCAVGAGLLVAVGMAATLGETKPTKVSKPSKPAVTLSTSTETPEQQRARWDKERKDTERKVAKATAKQHELSGAWSYHVFNDEGSGKQTTIATVQSENTINLDFPYRGEQYGRLNIRKHPRFGFDVYISIERGQMLCDSYNNPTIDIRFDDGPVQAFSCGESADHSSEYVFIKNAGRLEAAVKNAKFAYVSISMYNAGNKTFKFPVGKYNASKLN